MKVKLLFLVLIFFISSSIVGQGLNEYKYVIIPAKYGFQKSEDQYQLNSLTKFLFEKEGFTVFYDNLEMTAEVANNPCSALTANVDNQSNMFTTKLIIELLNCKNQKVLTSQEGRSKAKDYKKGFQEALRQAFESVSAQSYSYSGTGKTAIINSSTVEDARNTAKDVIEEVQEAEEVIEVVEEEQRAENSEEVIEVVERDEIVEQPTPQKTTSSSPNVLYAQANPLGFQLVDSSPKVVFVLLNTSKKDVFLLKDKSGMIYKENGTWFVEYYDQNALLKKPLEIKF